MVIGYDERYMNKDFQYLPKEGFTELFRNLLNHPNISVNLNIDALKHIILDDVNKRVLFDGEEVELLVFTGPVDELLGLKYGELSYRSLDIHYEWFDKKRELPSEIVSYPQADGYTRRTEYKYLMYDNSAADGTITATEFPCAYIRNNMEGRVGINNLSVEANNLGVGVESLGIGVNNLSIEANNLGVRVESLGVGVNNLGVGVNNLGVGVESLVIGVNNLGVGVNNLSIEANNLGVGVESLDVGVNNLGIEANNLGVGVESLGVEANNLGIEADNLYGRGGTEPFYPVLTEENRIRYECYRKEIETYRNIFLCGRLAEFKYYNMDDCILRAFDVFEKIKNLLKTSGGECL
jgi:hypothetical protein